VWNREAAHGEIDHQSCVPVRREGVAVHRTLGADRELTSNARAQVRGVVPRLGPLVEQFPRVAEIVEGLLHWGHSEVVVVLANRSGPGLLKVGESGGDLAVVDLGWHAFSAQLVEPVAGG